MILRVKNWKRFQHYTHRRPPWIKLHRELLDDMTWHRLPDASKALAPMLWLLASETDNGEIVSASDALAFRLRLASNALAQALSPLISNGWIECEQDASDMLATCLQPAISESESESESERESESDSTALPNGNASTLLADDDLGPKPDPKPNRKGARLSENWQPSLLDRTFASDLGLDPDKVFAEFRDYWIAVPGAKGRKLDWSATFRNRCRQIAEHSPLNRETFEQKRIREAHAAIEKALKK